MPMFLNRRIGLIAHITKPFVNGWYETSVLQDDDLKI